MEALIRIEGIGRESEQPPGAGTSKGERRSRRPQLPSLLLSQDTAVLRTVKNVASRESIPLDVCSESYEVLEMASARPYQALLIDFDVPGAGHVLNSLHQHTEKPVALAVVGSGALLGSAFQIGAVLAIHKPLTSETARLALKAAYAVAKRQGRKLLRRDTRIPCRIGWPGARVASASLLNLSEGGARIRADRCVLPGGAVTLRFTLPGTDAVLDVGAVGVWNDGTRDTGVRFERLNYRHAGRIRNWIRTAPVAAPPRPM